MLAYEILHHTKNFVFSHTQQFHFTNIMIWSTLQALNHNKTKGFLTCFDYEVFFIIVSYFSLIFSLLGFHDWKLRYALEFSWFSKRYYLVHVVHLQMFDLLVQIMWWSTMLASRWKLLQETHAFKSLSIYNIMQFDFNQQNVILDIIMPKTRIIQLSSKVLTPLSTKIILEFILSYAKFDHFFQIKSLHVNRYIIYICWWKIDLILGMANYYFETRKLLNTEYKFDYRGTADRYTHQMKTKNIISFVENTKSFVQYILFSLKTNEIND